MTLTVPPQTIENIIASFGGRQFTVLDVAKRIESGEPDLWSALLEMYGYGGKGSGRRYTAYSRINSSLTKMANAGKIHSLGSGNAPPDFGSPIITYWSALASKKRNVQKRFLEGKPRSVRITRHERSPEARKACIEHHGTDCIACGFSFGARYGEKAAGFIHVHHLIPIAEIGERYEIDPVHHLVPLCANCHAIVHQFQPMLSIDELTEMMDVSESNKITK